jgi:DNA-3-methyladenine glycosylase II
MTRITIPKPPLFSFEECLWFLDRNYDECLHHISGNTLSKVISINNKPLVFTLSADKKNLHVDIIQGDTNDDIINQLRLFIFDWLDLDRNITPFYRLLKANARLSYMANDYSGLRLIAIPDLHEALCWSVIGQQINLKFAYTLKRRLVEKYGEAIDIENKRIHLFPRPDVLQHATIEELRLLQMTTRKAEYLILVSRLFAEGTISKHKVLDAATFPERVQLLTAIKGIGAWTANYVLMKSVKDLQAAPYGDAGLLNALINHKLIKDKSNVKAIEKLFKPFKGWESYLVLYFWRSLSVMPV